MARKPDPFWNLEDALHLNLAGATYKHLVLYAFWCYKAMLHNLDSRWTKYVTDETIVCFLRLPNVLNEYIFDRNLDPDFDLQIFDRFVEKVNNNGGYTFDEVPNTPAMDTYIVEVLLDMSNCAIYVCSFIKEKDHKKVNGCVSSLVTLVDAAINISETMSDDDMNRLVAVMRSVWNRLYNTDISIDDFTNLVPHIPHTLSVPT